MLPGVEGAVVPAGHADSVDPQQGAVKDHVRLSGGDSDRLVQGRRQRGQQLDRLSQVAVHRRGPDLEPAGQVGVGLALAQVGHDQQRLATGRELAPAGRSLGAVAA